ncbi:hypothetical protein CDD82_6730 [Ophiocordyceps australis]|uniref:VOC domain-containing protein n=1 Tax=Ophiocordyceps australis TaxID=1399860 RepID=A0A2C5YUB6_9HYPO|nr:hypothetical protein CDD82_6730 [Ophiocordyceps australis]
MKQGTTPLAPVQDFDHLVLTCSDIAATSAWYARYLGMTPTTFTPPPLQNTPEAGLSFAESRSSCSIAKPSPSHRESSTRHALIFGNRKLNLHQYGREHSPRAAQPLPGTVDVCFLLAPDTDMAAVERGFRDAGIHVLEGGVVRRTGARGELKSVYVRDPDGNLIELSQYVNDVE